MSDSYYIRLGLTVRGPYSRSDLHELAARGGFSKAHEVSQDRKSWASASGFPELFPAARKVGPDKSSPGQRLSSDGHPRAGENDTSPMATDKQRQSTKVYSESRTATPEIPSQAAVRPMSPLTVWGMVTGPLGFTLLLLCTILVVLTLRVSKFAPSQNISLMVLLPVTTLLGIASLTLGHLSIRRFLVVPGSNKERNLIVIGLSCGYSIMILTVMYSLVLFVSAFS